jgi:hypothetical protein
MRWREFAEECPELAELAGERFGRDQLVLIGTLRSDGSARVSAVELDITAGELFIGMINKSIKALDLLRDPRVTVHSLPPGKDNPDGDLKLYGRAVEVREPQIKRYYEEALFARIAWRPTEPYHCFAFDITSGGFLRFDDAGEEVWRWRVGRPLRKRLIQRADGTAAD